MKLRRALEGAGIRIAGRTLFGEKSGRLVVAHYSDQLTRLLLYQNAFSSNAVAEVIGESVGGAEAIQSFLARELRLRDDELYVGHPSGLEFNRMTARASLKVLRALIRLVDRYSLNIEDVMPVCGVDSGTLRARLAGEMRASVVAKTGTLASLDRGVSSLVGVARTQDRGILLFAIFNSNGSVNIYRRFQDIFVQELIQEAGGPRQSLRTEDALAEEGNSITQSLASPESGTAGETLDTR
jgi:D-alanyl-D-alanine carboxypeptidase